MIRVAEAHASFSGACVLIATIREQNPLQARGLHDRAARLLLLGEAGQPDEEELPVLAEVFGSAIQITQEGVEDMRLTYGHGTARLGVDRVIQRDEAGHGSWHYVIRWCRAPRTCRRRLHSKTSPIDLAHPHDASVSDTVPPADVSARQTLEQFALQLLSRDSGISRRAFAAALRAGGYKVSSAWATDWLRNHRPQAAASSGSLPIEQCVPDLLRQEPGLDYRSLGDRLRHRGYAADDNRVRALLREFGPPARQQFLLELLRLSPDITRLALEEQARARGVSLPAADAAKFLSQHRAAEDESAEVEPAHLDVAYRLLRDHPGMGANPFYEEYKRLTADGISREAIRRWHAGCASSIRSGRLQDDIVGHAAALVVEHPTIGRRPLIKLIAGRLGYKPPKNLTASWLAEHRHEILAAQPSIPFGDAVLSEEVRALLPRLIMRHPHIGRVQMHSIMRAEYGHAVSDRALRAWWTQQRDDALAHRRACVASMPVLSLEDTRSHLDFLMPFMTDAVSAITAMEAHLRLTCPLHVMERILSETQEQSADFVAHDHRDLVLSHVDELLGEHAGMSIASMHTALSLRGVLTRRPVLDEIVRERRLASMHARAAAAGGCRRVSLAELRDHVSVLSEHAGSASAMIAALESQCSLTCTIACMNRYIAERRQHVAGYDEQSPEWLALMDHAEHLEDQLRRCPTIKRRALLTTLQQDVGYAGEEAFDVWWQRDRPAIASAWSSEIASMPVLDCRGLLEHQELIASLQTKSEVVAIHALRYHRRVNCSRQSMRTLLGHLINESAMSRAYHNVRKRPAALSEVNSLAGLQRHATRLREWVATELDDEAILRELSLSVGVRCTIGLIRQFRQRDMAAADIQRAWRSYSSGTFWPKSYEAQPDHAREFTPGNFLLEWIHLCSWTFCESCGRSRPNTTLSDLRCPTLSSPSVTCSHKRNYFGKCSRPVTDHVYVPAEERAGAQLQGFATQEAYICPRREDWPVFDEAQARYVSSRGADDPRPSLLDLPADEISRLQLVDLFCDFKRQRGQRQGRAPVWNYKKMSVIRAEWRRQRPDDAMTTDMGRAALRWFKHDHPTYARYYAQHQKVLADHVSHPSLPWYILTPRLLLDMDGIEVAARPILYPHFAFGDSDLRTRMAGTHVSDCQTLSMKASLLRKCLSRCLAYRTDVLWTFLVHDIVMARNCSSMISMAERRGLPPEAMAAKHQQTEAFWRREQDVHADIVRQMRARCRDREGHPDLWAYCNLGGDLSLAYPNVFLTIAPCEWKFPLLYAMFEQHKFPRDGPKFVRLSELGGPLALHLYNVLNVVLQGLIGSIEFWRSIENYVLRIEFQGRGTLHVHIALWAILYAHRDLRGTTGQASDSPLVEYLTSLGFESIDIQYGEGYLNYINGYLGKASDAMDFRLREHLRSGESHRWRMTYRILCKSSPCVPEIFVDWSGLPLIRRSFQVAEVYPPVPRPDMDLRQNDSYKLYAHYLKSATETDGVRRLSRSFLVYARHFRLQQDAAVPRRPRAGQMVGVGVRFAFELLDVAIGQYGVMFLPHTSPDQLCPREEVPMEYTKCFIGALQYLSSLRCGSSRDYVVCADHTVVDRRAFPSAHLLPDGGEEGSLLFPQDEYDTAFRYMSACLDDDMRDRTPSRSRALTLQLRLRALLRLYRHVEYPAEQRALKIRDWVRVHHVSISERSWSPEQQEALDAIRDGLRVDDANAIRELQRLLHLTGDPGSGKSEVFVHAAARAADEGLHVNILCPTGALVHAYRDRLPVSDRIVVETIHSGFQISRKADMVAQYMPPTRLRRYDLFLIDEASQLEDHIAQKLLVGLAELPQKPFVAIGADFRQLRPVGGGTLMKDLCDRLRTIKLRTIHRTRDAALLEFLQLIRLHQPLKSIVEEFFRGRILSGDLRDAVARTLAWMTAVPGRVFVWLCVTNAGADKVNAAVLAHLGLDPAAGVPGDPKVGAGGIVVRAGLYVRLTRNLDKDRGFVNGAIGVIEVVLSAADGVFLARLTTGTLVLVHPITEGDLTFLPCAYGYATTIRRAQGASLDAGCLYFDHCYPPERGYAYVGASRFHSKVGSFVVKDPG